MIRLLLVLFFVLSGCAGKGEEDNSSPPYTHILPSELRPALSVHYVPIFVRNNSADVAAPGYLTVHSNGDISVRKSFTDDNFTNTGTVGGPRGSIAVSYAID